MTEAKAISDKNRHNLTSLGVFVFIGAAILVGNKIRLKESIIFRLPYTVTSSLDEERSLFAGLSGFEIQIQSHFLQGSKFHWQKRIFGQGEKEQKVTPI